MGKRLFSSANGTSVSKWNISSPPLISYSDNYMYYAGKIYSIPVSSDWNTINNNKTEIGTINCTNNQITFDRDNIHIYSVYDNSLYIYKIENNKIVQEDKKSLGDTINMKYMLNTPFCIVSNETSTNYIYVSVEDVITSIERNGYRYVSINAKNVPKSSKVLEGTSYVGLNGINELGTMPNNGELNYTPSTEEQIIPAGYTSGGVISAVDASIDENIKAENIKKDITVLGVTGTATFGNRINGIVSFENREDLLADTSETTNTIGLVQTLIPADWEFKQNTGLTAFVIPKSITLKTAPTEGKYYPIYYVNDAGDGPGMGPMTSINIHHPSTTDGVHYYIQEGDHMMSSIKSWVSEDGINYTSETDADDIVQSDNYTWYIGGDSTEFTEEDISVLTAIIHGLGYGVPEIYLWNGTEWEQYGNLAGTITATEYNTALETAQNILGKEENVNE